MARVAKQSPRRQPRNYVCVKVAETYARWVTVITVVDNEIGRFNECNLDLQFLV